MEDMFGVILFAVLVLTVIVLMIRSRQRTEDRDADVDARLDNLEQQVNPYGNGEQR